MKFDITITLRKWYNNISMNYFEKLTSTFATVTGGGASEEHQGELKKKDKVIRALQEEIKQLTNNVEFVSKSYEELEKEHASLLSKIQLQNGALDEYVSRVERVPLSLLKAFNDALLSKALSLIGEEPSETSSLVNFDANFNDLFRNHLTEIHHSILNKNEACFLHEEVIEKEKQQNAILKKDFETMKANFEMHKSHSSCFALTKETEITFLQQENKNIETKFLEKLKIKELEIEQTEIQLKKLRMSEANFKVSLEKKENQFLQISLSNQELNKKYQTIQKEIMDLKKNSVENISNEIEKYKSQISKYEQQINMLQKELEEVRKELVEEKIINQKQLESLSNEKCKIEEVQEEKEINSKNNYEENCSFSFKSIEYGTMTKHSEFQNESLISFSFKNETLEEKTIEKTDIKEKLESSKASSSFKENNKENSQFHSLMLSESEKSINDTFLLNSNQIIEESIMKLKEETFLLDSEKKILDEYSYSTSDKTEKQKIEKEFNISKSNLPKSVEEKEEKNVEIYLLTIKEKEKENIILHLETQLMEAEEQKNVAVLELSVLKDKFKQAYTKYDELNQEKINNEKIIESYKKNEKEIVLNEQIKEINESYSQLEEKHKTLEEKEMEIKKMNSVQEVEINKLNEEIKEKENEKEKLKTKLKEIEVFYKTEIMQLKSKIDKKEIDISKSADRNKELEGKLNNYKYKIDEKETEYKKIEDSLNILKKELNEQKEKQVLNTKKNYEEKKYYEEEINKLRHEMERVVIDNARLIDNEKISLKKELNEEKEQLKQEKNQVEQKYQNQFVLLKKENEQKIKENEQKIKENQELKNELNQEKKINENIRIQIIDRTKMTEHIKKLEEVENEQNQKMHLKDEEIKRLFISIQGFKATMTELEEGIETYQSIAEEKDKETEMMRIALDTEIIQNKELKEKINYLEKQLIRSFDNESEKEIRLVSSEKKNDQNNKNSLLPLKKLLLKYFEIGSSHESRLQAFETLCRALDLSEQEIEIVGHLRRNKIVEETIDKKEDTLPTKLFHFLTSE